MSPTTVQAQMVESLHGDSRRITRISYSNYTRAPVASQIGPELSLISESQEIWQVLEVKKTTKFIFLAAVVWRSYERGPEGV